MNDFSKIKVETTGVSPGRLVEGLKKLWHKQSAERFDDSQNEKDQHLRESIETNRLLTFIKIVINRTLSLFKLGDTLKVLFRKDH